MSYKIMSHCFFKLYKGCIRNVNAELDLPNQATKANLKGVAAADTSNLAAKSNLTSLKTMVGK